MVQDGEINVYIKHVHLCFLVRSSVKNHKGRIEGGEKEKVGGRWVRRSERGTEKGQAGGRSPQGQRIREEKTALNCGISESK